MKPDRRTAGIIIASLVAAVVAWNIAWRYDEANLRIYSTRERVRVRTHLITGKAERLSSYGWVPLEYPKPSPVSAEAMATPSPGSSPTVYDQILDGKP